MSEPTTSSQSQQELKKVHELASQMETAAHKLRTATNLIGELRGKTGADYLNSIDWSNLSIEITTKVQAATNQLLHEHVEYLRGQLKKGALTI